MSESIKEMLMRVDQGFIKETQADARNHTIYVGESRYRKLSVETSSKGNQRKWYDIVDKRYVKEQFLYQDIYWKDYIVERLSWELACQLNTLGIEVLEQRICVIEDYTKKTYGVISKDFCEAGETFISYNRLCKILEIPTISEQMFPMMKFNQIVETIKQVCNLDITDYLIVMVVMDYLLLNEDRHLNNFGIIMKRDGTYRVAPLFDFGLGLFEHDRRYEGRVLEDCLERVEGKPFHQDLTVILKALCKNEKYKDKIKQIIESEQGIWNLEFPSQKAADYFKYAFLNLKDWIKE